jgi:hypothetical protein
VCCRDRDGLDAGLDRATAGFPGWVPLACPWS